MNSFFARKFVVQGIFIALIAVLITRLFYIQVISDEYILSAENNVIRRLPIYPARGVILDRYEKILVQMQW